MKRVGLVFVLLLVLFGAVVIFYNVGSVSAALGCYCQDPVIAAKLANGITCRDSVNRANGRARIVCSDGTDVPGCAAGVGRPQCSALHCGTGGGNYVCSRNPYVVISTTAAMGCQEGSSSSTGSGGGCVPEPEPPSVPAGGATSGGSGGGGLTPENIRRAQLFLDRINQIKANDVIFDIQSVSNLYPNYYSSGGVPGVIDNKLVSVTVDSADGFDFDNLEASVGQSVGQANIHLFSTIPIQTYQVPVTQVGVSQYYGVGTVSGVSLFVTVNTIEDTAYISDGVAASLTVKNEGGNTWSVVSKGGPLYALTLNANSQIAIITVFPLYSAYQFSLEVVSVDISDESRELPANGESASGGATTIGIGEEDSVAEGTTGEAPNVAAGESGENQEGFFARLLNAIKFWD